MWLGLKAGQGVNRQSGRGEGLRPPVGEEAMGICSPSHFYTLSLASDQPSFIWGCLSREQGGLSLLLLILLFERPWGAGSDFWLC